MNYGYLKEHFKVVAVKILSEVEVNPSKSNQHEFNAIKSLRDFLGSEKIKAVAKYLYMDSFNDEFLETHGETTYYDARENHPTRTEYRIYYNSNEVMAMAKAGDLLFMALTTEDEFLYIVTPPNSSEASQIGWLFGLKEYSKKFRSKTEKDLNTELGFVGSQILEIIGIETQPHDQMLLELLLKTFGAQFPSTRVFSEFARQQTEVDINSDPDHALLSYMQKEEMLFKLLEKHIIEELLKPYFKAGEMDVDEFIRISLSVQNRRKSRAGYAMEYHLAHIFHQIGIRYSSQAFTERKNKPDFIFPGIDEYKNPEFPEKLLRMLGVKTSLKERWAQVLAEAERIDKKHLITIQPAISTSQTSEMLEKNLWLVIPKEIQSTYKDEQRVDLISLEQFTSEVLENQSEGPDNLALF